MTEAPPLALHTDEEIAIRRRMAIVAREVRAGRRRFRRHPDWTMSLREMLARLGAVGACGLEGLPRYFELQSGLIDTLEPGRGEPRPQSARKAQETVTRETGAARALPVFGGYRDCAQVCGVTERWMAHHIDRLIREEAFPPARGGGGHRKWSLALVAQWAAGAETEIILARARRACAKTRRRK